MYADVAFPLRIPPLTYRIPEGLSPDIVGRIVEAPLMGRTGRGLVVSVSERSNLKMDLKEITRVIAPFAGEAYLSFLSWLSDYYIMPLGGALKAGFFDDALRILKNGGISPGSPSVTASHGLPSVRGAHAAVAKQIAEGGYRSFLLHAPSASVEQDCLLDILGSAIRTRRGAIILVPEFAPMERLLHAVREIAGERLAVLHSKLTRAKRTAALERIIAGESDVLVGTRSAVLAPLKEVSFVAVMAEHSPSYKGMEGLRYHGRDIAVMRGFTEKASVLLSSVCPSVESVHNCRIGKYHWVDLQGKVKRPQIRVMDMRRQDQALSPEVLKKTELLVRKGERVLFLMNRKGYSLLRCGDCGHIPRCPRCAIPLVFHKAGNLLRCPSCGIESASEEQCSECLGVAMTVMGAGTERVGEELEKAFDQKAVMLEKGKAAAKDSAAGTVPFVVGTSLAMRQAGAGLFSSAVVLNTDMLLALPDFRAHERAFQEITQVAGMVTPEGTIYLQTHFPRERIIRQLRGYDFSGFYEAELSLRREMDYPPFARIIAVSLVVLETEGMMELVRGSLPSPPEGVSVMGPVEVPFPRKGRQCIQVVLKSPDRKALRGAARDIAGRLKALKRGKIIIDVDPLRI